MWEMMLMRAGDGDPEAKVSMRGMRYGVGYS